jgi:hypothetical protein
MLAGAFEAVSASAPEEAAVQAVYRALAYAVGRVVGELSVEGAAVAAIERWSDPDQARDITAATRTR